MRVLWAPWRMAYVGAPKTPGCIFCTASTADDQRAALVLAQRPALVMLNRFPYASGHLMVAPHRHVADLSVLPPDDFQTLMGVLQRAATLVADAYHPEGMNIGLNLGAAAGAGVTDHLHWHIVPRWSGDTNFMPMLADVRVIPEHLDATYERLRPLFAPLAA
ncbi:MAG TPA: HIT domain-containing protein [Candidatus Margulisiibacteriota bacterium]|nr:HIT domain-containing protein [Candidatus Margulisiibacteriota bacterium]